jgi:hypothetical protein
MLTTVPPRVEPDEGEMLVSSGNGNSYRNMAEDPGELPTPTAFFTDTVTRPGGDSGVVTLIWLSSATVRSLVYISPNRTFSVPVNPDPVMVTEVPPATGPEEGETPDILGRATSSYMYTAVDFQMLLAPAAL